MAFPECLRWHDGALWFSDIAAGRVHRLAEDGSLETIAEPVSGAAGLGWLPDGRLLIVAGDQRRLLRLERRGRLVSYADLQGHAEHSCNDMLVDARGRAWVGNWGFDYAANEPPRPASLLLVGLDGNVVVAARELLFPNGCAVTPDGATLIVAETFAAQLTAFTIDDDGPLVGRRVWADLRPATPDGICLDAEGAVWVASPASGEVLRVREGGTVSRRVAVPQQPLSVMLGGADRRTLYIASSRLFERIDGRFAYASRARLCAERLGRIDSMRVDIPGTGWP